MNRRPTLLVGLVFVLSVAASRVVAGGSLVVTDQVIEQLRALRKEQKFTDGFGIIKPHERAEFEPLVNDLIDRLLAGLRDHPSESWVIAQMDPTVEAFYLADTELRDPCVDYMERIFRILGIKGANGAFKKYLLDF